MTTSTLTRLHESAPFATIATPAEGSGRFRIRVISAGIGSSGVYPAETLKAAAEARVFAAGTHMYLDHPTESEAWERPERSVRDLAAVLTSDAVYVDEDGGALDAEIEVFTPWRQTIAEMLKTIGVSIRASAEVTESDAQGRPIIGRIIEAQSVDFVTKAGRGGKVLSLIESARSVGRAVARGVAEATANDRREQLADLVKNAHGAEGTWVWVRDFDDTTVWFEVEAPDDYSTYQQAYTVTDDVATALTGERTEVRAQTSYVPVTATADEATSVPSRPAGQSTATESQEDTMATTQIEESRLAQLEKDAGRATALESERDAAVRRAEEAEARAAKALQEANEATAERIVREAFDTAGVTAPKTVARLAASAPLTESGDIDVEALKQSAEESAAEIAEASGAGRVRGLGGSTQPNGDGEDLSEAELDAELAAISGRTVKEA